MWLCGGLVRWWRQVGARRLVADCLLDGARQLGGRGWVENPRLLRSGRRLGNIGLVGTRRLGNAGLVTTRRLGSGGRLGTRLMATGLVGGGLLHGCRRLRRHWLRPWRRRPAAEWLECRGGLARVAGRQRAAALPCVIRVRRTLSGSVRASVRAGVARVGLRLALPARVGGLWTALWSRGVRSVLLFGSAVAVRSLLGHTMQFETRPGQLACRRPRSGLLLLGLLILLAPAEAPLVPARGFGAFAFGGAFGASAPSGRVIDQVLVWEVLYGRFVAAGDIAF